MTPVGIGITLALVNTVVVAFGLAFSMGDPISEVVPTVVMCGSMPAMILGAVAGHFAGTFASRPMWIRIPLIALFPLAFVLGMGELLGIVVDAVGACIPTMVAVLLLERATRSRVTPLVPVARVS